MKMRSNLPFSGIFMSSAVQCLSEQMPQPDGQQTERDRRHHVGEGVQHLSFLRQLKGLKTEGRKRRVAAAEAGHEKAAQARADDPAPVRTGERGKQADG